MLCFYILAIYACVYTPYLSCGPSACVLGFLWHISVTYNPQRIGDLNPSPKGLVHIRTVHTREGLYIHTYITSHPNVSVSYFGKKWYWCICYIIKYNETVSTNIDCKYLYYSFCLGRFWCHVGSAVSQLMAICWLSQWDGNWLGRVERGLWIYDHVRYAMVFGTAAL